MIVLHGSIPGLHDPLSTLRTVPRGTMRMTRGQSGSLVLLCMALASTTPHRSPGALPAPTSPRPPRLTGAGMGSLCLVGGRLVDSPLSWLCPFQGLYGAGAPLIDEARGFTMNSKLVSGSGNRI